jgi:hypothetical protein
VQRIITSSTPYDMYNRIVGEFMNNELKQKSKDKIVKYYKFTIKFVLFNMNCISYQSSCASNIVKCIAYCFTLTSVAPVENSTVSLILRSPVFFQSYIVT